MEIKEVILDSEKEKVKKFLKTFALEYDDDLDYSLYISEDDKVIGTISRSANIIKAFAVSKKYKGSLASQLISEMIKNIFKNGYHFYQAYTKPEIKQIFESLNFYEIISSEKVSLLESKNRNINQVLENIKVSNNLVSNNTACIVMNCNPFTLGHLYLIKHAAKLHDLVIIFLVEEEKSYFSFQDRLQMVKKGIKGIDNVAVIGSSNYLISSLTFPTYFLKQENIQVEEQAMLDTLIFKKYFIPIFGLKKRYLGSEEDLVTKKYNNILNEELAEFIEIIPRKKLLGKNISATTVRKYLKEKDFDGIKELVPKSTYDFLIKKYG